MTDGDTAIFRKLVPGRVYEASAKYRMVVSIGVPPVVDIELNGRLVDLRDQQSRRITRVNIDQTNFESFFNRTRESAAAQTTEMSAPPAGKTTKQKTLDKHKSQKETALIDDGGQ